MFSRSLFGNSLLSEFEDDPFFTGHREHMRDMQSLFNNDYGRHRVTDGTDERDRDKNRGHKKDERDVFAPFGGMFRDFGKMFENIHTTTDDPNCHSFASTSMMSYSKTDDGPPKMYQATSQTRKAPGGLKETRRMERDSVSGTDKMAIGHHINDRGHVIHKVRVRQGEIEESHDYHNLDENEFPQFNQEWQQSTGRLNDLMSKKVNNSHGALPRNDAKQARSRHRQLDKPRRN